MKSIHSKSIFNASQLNYNKKGFNENTRTENKPGGKRTIPTNSLVWIGETHPTQTRRANIIGMLTAKKKKQFKNLK